MFLRRYERRKNGKPHTYWALVESYRTARSRQRVVAYLGELKPSEQDGWAKLGSHLDGQARPAAAAVAVRSAASTTFRATRRVLVRSRASSWTPADFGDVWMAWGLWRMLGLDDLLERSSLGAKTCRGGRWRPFWRSPVSASRERIAHRGDVVSADGIGGVVRRRPGEGSHGSVVQGLDRLLPHKEAIEKHLRHRLGELFALKCELLLYDVTSTYFEGDMEECPMAKRGYSRDTRPDRPQVCIGWSSPRMAFRWVTRSSPATRTTRRR